MLYHVSRNGQLYGPYTLADLEHYVASGNVLLTDMARAEDSTEWLPVAQVLGTSAAPATPPPGAYAAPGALPYGAPVSAYPDPPNLHWAVVLVLGLITCGLFIVVWDIVQAVWMRRVNPRSHALFYYIAGDAFNVAGNIFFRAALYGGLHSTLGIRMLPVGFITFLLIEVARFDMRRSLEQHYNGPEPIGLTLGPIMTFFFGSLYFQYHLTRINEMKRMARYRAGTL